MVELADPELYYYTYIKGGTHHGKDNYTGGGGVNLEEVTALPGDIIKGKTAYTQGSDDPTTGTLQLTGNAQAAHVLAGETFYTNNCKTKLTGTMTVNSLLSFSVAAYSGRRVLAKWQNPNQAAGKPFSGVIIRYSTSGYPGTTGGTQIYKGAGNNTASEGQSQAYLDLPSLSTKYYLSIYPYATCSAGEMTGAVINATVTTASVINKTFTAGGSYTIPEGYTKMDLFAVGGGAAGGRGTTNCYGGRGGSGGFTSTVKNISVLTGQVISIVVGAGGVGDLSLEPPAYGSASYVSRSGSVLINANGAKFDNYTEIAGGSGGGAPGYCEYAGDYCNGGIGGSDGKNGGAARHEPSKGQGTTTRAWGSSSGTLYAGGGGGGGGTENTMATSGGAGGAGGGARGGNATATKGKNSEKGMNGAANSGGGAGGGGGGDRSYRAYGGDGGSGIVLLKLY